MRWLTEMGVFARVVELGGFSKAARNLGMTTSAVSKQVGRLEAGLGVTLLHRTTRALSLTEAGNAVFGQCQALLQAAEAAEAAASRLAIAPRGTLKISASVAFGQRRLLPLLPDFLARYPELNLEVTLLDRFVDLAEEGFDLVLRLCDHPPEGLAARHLGPVEFVLCAAPAYLARQGVPRLPEDLSDHACICQGTSVQHRDWCFLSTPQREARARVAGRLVVNGGEAVRVALLAGLGCAVLPAFVVADDLAAGRLERLLPGFRPLGAFNNLYALYLPSRQSSTKVRACIDYLAPFFSTSSSMGLDQPHRR